MIFNTFDNDLTGTTNKIGIFHKSFDEIGHDLSAKQGLFTSLFSGNNISSKDLQSIKAMDNDMKKGSTTAQAWQANMTGCTAVAKQQTKQCLENKKSLSQLAAGLEHSTFAAKAGKAALSALTTAGNIFVSAAISKGIELAATAIDNYIHRLDHAKEALEITQSELSSLKSEFNDNKKQIEKLESIDPVSFSFTDKNELQQLKEQNEELKIRMQYTELQKQDELESVAGFTKEEYNQKYAIPVTRENIDAYKTLYTTSPSKQPVSNYLTGGSSQTASPYAPGTQANHFTKESNSLFALIAKYEYYEEEKKKAIQAGDTDAITKYNEKLKETSKKLQTHRTVCQEYWNDLSAIGKSSPEFESITNTLAFIDDTLLTKGQNFVDFINSDSLSENKEKLMALANSGKFTADNLATNFSEVNDYLMENGLTIDDLISLIKVYEEELYSIDTYSPKRSFSDSFNSSAFSDTREQLLSLAKSGELTANTLESTENYKKLLDETGLSADTVKSNILGILNANDKLAGASAGLNFLTNAYTEFQEKGFVLADTLSSLPDAFKDLEGYDLFEEIVGDPSNGNEKIQQAFNDIVKQYLVSQDILTELTGASEGTIQSYIANLKAMGITNADEVVNQTVAIISSENQLISAAETEYYNTYLRYLSSKNEADLEYLRLSSSNNSQLLTALGSAYSSDYYNWCNLLSVKAEEYNKFVSRVTDHDGNLVVGGRNSKTQIDNARKDYDIAEANANKAEDKLKLDLSTINTNFGTTSFTPQTSSGSSGSSPANAPETSETTETFNFIETLLSKLSSAFDKLKSKGENTFLSFTARSRAYSSSLTKVNEQINTLKAASDSYMAKANSFGLEEEWARQVRDGSLNIAEVTDDDLKERIKNYQTWYEKAAACNDEIDELSKTQKQLTQSKLELLITKYEQLADKAASANDRIENSIGLKESYGSYGSEKDYKNLNKNNRAQIKYANTQINKYKELQKTVKKGSEEWYNYQKKIDSNSASVQKLTQSIFDNAKALAEQSKTKADVKIEKYDNSDELFNAKIGNTNSYQTQNKFVNEEIRNINRRQKAYNTAVSTDKAGITSAGRAIHKTKTTKENKSLLKKIKPYLKSKKEIPSSLLSQAAKLSDNHLLYQKCVQYNAYVAAYETDKAAADLYKQQGAQEKADLAIQKQDNISKYYANRQKKYDQKATELNSAIDAATARGYQTSQNYYDTLVTNEKNRNGSLVTERGKLVRSLATSVKNGSIKKGTDEWYELCQQIDDVTNAINDSNLSLIEYENQIRQIKWDNFDNLENRIRNITSELDFAINELSREDLASNETGKLTDNGNAVAALHASNYTAYLQQARDYETEISKIEKDLSADPYNQKLLDRRQDLIKSYQDAVTAAQDEKYAIIDLYTKGYEALTNKVSDLISEYVKLLDAEKNAYDYQNNIADKTKEIANIRKMLDAYSGDISEEARTKVQSLTVSLADAEKDLKETQYDKYISDTKDMLSGLQEDFEKNIQEIIDSMSQNFDSLMQKIEAESLKSNAAIKKSLEDIGYKSSTEFASILDGSGISKATIQMIADTKNFQDKMTEYADTIANAVKTTNVTNEVNKKIQNDGSKALSTDLADSKKDVSSNKKSYTTQKEKREKAETAKEKAYKNYEKVKKKYGKNSSQALKAKKIYEKAKATYDEANSKYLKLKDNYNDAKVRSTVLEYLNKHLTVTSSSRSSYSDLNKALYDQYGQRVLSNAEILELADLLEVKYDNQKSSGAVYKRLKDIGIKGFKVGSRNVPQDQLALLAEEGPELRFDKNRGVLHQVGKGDKIFTNTDTENLWNWAKMNPVQFANSLNLLPALSAFEPNINSGDVTIDLGGIVMNGVNDVETFGRQIRAEFCKNGKTTKCIVEAVSSEMLGKGIGNAKLYR